MATPIARADSPSDKQQQHSQYVWWRFHFQSASLRRVHRFSYDQRCAAEKRTTAGSASYLPLSHPTNGVPDLLQASISVADLRQAVEESITKGLQPHRIPHNFVLRLFAEGTMTGPCRRRSSSPFFCCAKNHTFFSRFGIPSCLCRIHTRRPTHTARVVRGRQARALCCLLRVPLRAASSDREVRLGGWSCVRSGALVF
jgi:hypothetical protein